ncbi:hypothetical protein [Acidovorax sp.]|uniref:hypothetical protein n=1 Tax=Acidovorax sp. TaxID=1872122 RepID=UPI002ACDFC66|nr:hypothetical protein [Acidovorax sp.]MDZ7862463.1 hypothetical protein [Acidovorax sp.]
MGRIATNTPDAPDQPLSLIAAAAIAAGDLVKLEATNGLARTMMADYTIAQQNTAAGATSLRGYNYVDTGVYGTTGSAYGLCLRNIVPTPDGGWATVYTGNGSNANTNITFALYGTNAALKFKSTLTTSASVNNARLTKAGADNVMAVWNEGTSLYGAVLNKTTGAVVTAAFAIGTVASAAAGTDWNLTTLASGEVVVAYSGGSNAAFKRYSAAGVLQGAEVVVEAGSTPNYFSILALAAGGFVVRYARTAATQGIKLGRYNAAGVLQGALVSVTSGAGLIEGGTSAEAFEGAVEHKLIELSNGNIVTNNPAVLTQVSIKIYDASLNLLNTVTVLPSVTSGNHGQASLCARSAGGFYFCSNNSSPMLQYDNTGLLVRTGNSGTGGLHARLFDRPGTGPATVVFAQTLNTTSAVYVRSLDGSLVLESTQLTAINNASNSVGQVWAELLDSGVVVVGYAGRSTSLYYVQGVASVTAASVIGVASAAAAAGAPVRLSTAGKFAINQSFAAEAFDRRSAAPAGTKGNVYGSTAVLAGLAG